MQTTTFAAGPADAAVVAEAISTARGSDDSGQRMLESYPGPLIDHIASSITNSAVAGEWVAVPHTTDRGAVLYVHGGRFQYDESPDVFAARLSDATKLPVLLWHYRLAPQHQYPAPIDDVVSAHRHLIEQGFAADRIVWVGHSAGATLVLSALEMLGGAHLPKPAAVVAVSPITDFTWDTLASCAVASNDIVTEDEIRQTRTAYLGDIDPGHGPQSPLAGAMDGLPPLLIACGGAELLRNDAVSYAQSAAQRGNDVTLQIYEGMPHGYPLLAMSSATTLAGEIADFTNRHLPGGMRAQPDVQALSVRRIGWAGYLITTEAGTRVLVDPYLHGAEGIHAGIPESPFATADFDDVDIVLVTHAGYDHRAQAIEIAQAGQATLVCGSALAQAAAAAGLPAGRIAITVSGVEFRSRDVTIKSLPCHHFSSMTVDGEFVADQPQSFVVSTATGSRIFCGGDLSLSEDLKTWAAFLYRPQVAVLGIGGLPVGAGTIVELPPAEAAMAAQWLNVDTVIPVHYLAGSPAVTQLAADLSAIAPHISVQRLEVNELWQAPWPVPIQESTSRSSSKGD